MSTALAVSPADPAPTDGPDEAAGTAPRPLKVRRMSFDTDEGIGRRHFAGGDLVMSHVVSVLSGFFPEGEDYFVRSVRHFRDRIDDPELKKQVAGFIGQEAIHGREHRELNDRLRAMGYLSHVVDRFTKASLGLDERFAPARYRLAVTAALEHYTATLAEVLLGDDEARSELDDDEVKAILLWHAVEESEHKAVAFDVYQQVCGDLALRRRAMTMISVGFVGSATAFTLASLALDPASRDIRRLARSLGRVRHSPWLSGEVRRRIRDYYREDFHPDDHDATDLLDEWRDRLFGSDGELTDRLAG
jgi:predicted metal-dependent hydrolase